MTCVDKASRGVKARYAALRSLLMGSIAIGVMVSSTMVNAADDVAITTADTSLPNARSQSPAAAAMAAQLADEHAVAQAGRAPDAPASASAAVVTDTVAAGSDAFAANATSATAASRPLGDAHDPVYLAFGGKDGIRTIVDDLYAELLIDPRTKSYFDGAPIERIERLLTEQICSLLNGPCVYTGRSMRRTHAGQNINRAAFDALVEDLEDAMDKHGVPYRYQTRLLAKLAPMYRDVEDRP